MNRPLKNERSSGGMASYDGQNVSKPSKHKGPSKPATDQYGQSLNRTNWKGNSSKKSWK